MNRATPPEKINDSDILVMIAEEDCDICRWQNRGYATITAGNGKRTIALRSNAFKSWLRRRFRHLQGRVPPAAAVRNSLIALEDKSTEMREERVFMRTARHEGCVYIDLGDDSFDVVKVGPDGWSVIDTPPVRFVRGATMMSFPRPVGGGSVLAIRQFLNVASKQDFQLLITWCLAAMMPEGPYPIMSLAGEHGTGKTSFAKFVHELVDPSRLPLRALPRNERDLYIATGNTHLLSFDNISIIAHWLSDAFCKISTGGGMSTRELYSDDGEVVFEAVRPLILNGIEDLVTRPDLADRAIIFTLPVIAAESRLESNKLDDAFQAARPAMFGALLDLLVLAIARIPEVNAERLPRMAGFAMTGIAIEGTFAGSGSFMDALEANRAATSDLLLSGDPVAVAIARLMADSPGAWQGTATDLAKLIEARLSPARVLNPAALAGRLRRLAPVLRARGIAVDFDRDGKDRTRIISISQR